MLITQKKYTRLESVKDILKTFLSFSTSYDLVKNSLYLDFSEIFLFNNIEILFETERLKLKSVINIIKDKDGLMFTAKLPISNLATNKTLIIKESICLMYLNVYV